MGSVRAGITWSVVRAALVWATVGTCVAAVICFPLVDFYAFFVLIDAAPAALSLGVIEALWLFLEKSKATNSQQFIRFGFISGSGLGILALPPALAQSDAIFSSWLAPAVFVVAALVGGGVGGVLSAASFRLGTTSRTPLPSMLRLLAGCCLIFVPLGVAEYFHYGPIVQSRLEVLAALSKSSVLNLPAGNAKGSQWTGCYTWDYHGIVGGGVGGGQLRITQVDGRLTILLPDRTLEGGVDSSGQFWAGSDTTSYGLEQRILWKGKFVNDSHFRHSDRSSVLKNGDFSNSGVLEGTGNRIPCL